LRYDYFFLIGFRRGRRRRRRRKRRRRRRRRKRKRRRRRRRRRRLELEPELEEGNTPARLCKKGEFGEGLQLLGCQQRLLPLSFVPEDKTGNRLILLMWPVKH